MKYFLAKSEPSDYSIDDLEKDGESEWEGVRHPVAVKHLKSMKVGDKVLIYHSGKNPGIVGLAEVIARAYQDPKDPISFVPKFKFLNKFSTQITLEQIKSSHKFDDWALVRQGRLSTMDVPESFTAWLDDLGVNLG